MATNPIWMETCLAIPLSILGKKITLQRLMLSFGVNHKNISHHVSMHFDEWNSKWIKELKSY